MRPPSEGHFVDKFPWRCPQCKGELNPGSDLWSCRSCAAEFRALRGIPDLRTRDDVYLSNEEDWAFANRLVADYDRLDFRGLLDRYFDIASEVSPAGKRRQVTHILTAPGRIVHWLDALGPVGGGPLLDLGCGSGSFLSAVGRCVPDVQGVDVALRWLLVARKRLDEEGLPHVPLACACAEDLPVADDSIAGVVAGDVIEHVADQRATLSEVHRALQPGGRVFMASPNRYSLGLEPHVGVWGVGFLPRRWMRLYVRWINQADFRAIHTLGFREWRQLLRHSPFTNGRINVPLLPRDDLIHFGRIKRVCGRLYNASVQTRGGMRFARAFGPLFHVVAEKPKRADPSSAPRPPSRAIHRRSTRSAKRA